VNTPALNFGGPEFNSHPREWLFCLRFFVVFLSHFKASTEIILQSRPQLFPSTSYPIHYSLITFSFDAT
jgi:hypothetical protein